MTNSNQTQIAKAKAHADTLSVPYSIRHLHDANIQTDTVRTFCACVYTSACAAVLTAYDRSLMLTQLHRRCQIHMRKVF